MKDIQLAYEIIEKAAEEDKSIDLSELFDKAVDPDDIECVGYNGLNSMTWSIKNLRWKYPENNPDDEYRAIIASDINKVSYTENTHKGTHWDRIGFIRRENRAVI